LTLTDFAGQGEFSFPYLITIERGFTPSIEMFYELNREFPKAMIAITCGVGSGELMDLMILDHLAHTQCLFIHDKHQLAHPGHAHSHIGLNIRATNRLVLFKGTEFFHLIEPKNVPIIKRNDFTVYDCRDNPIHVIANASQGHAHCYWENAPGD